MLDGDGASAGTYGVILRDACCDTNDCDAAVLCDRPRSGKCLDIPACMQADWNFDIIAQKCVPNDICHEAADGSKLQLDGRIDTCVTFKNPCD